MIVCSLFLWILFIKSVLSFLQSVIQHIADMNFIVSILLVICTYDFSWIIQLKSSIIPVLLSCSSFITYTDSHDSYIQSRNKATRTMLKPQYNSTVVYQQMDLDKVLTSIPIQIMRWSIWEVTIKILLFAHTSIQLVTCNKLHIIVPL